MTPHIDPIDPRLNDAAGDTLGFSEVQPIVGSQARRGGSMAAALGIAMAAGGLFAALNAHRSQLLHTVSLVTPASAAIPPVPSAPPPLALAPPVPQAPQPAAPEPAPAPVALPPAPPVAVVAPDIEQRLHAPAVIVDLGAAQPEATKVLAANTISAPGGDGAPGAAGASSPGGGAAAAIGAGGGPEDQFAARVEDAAPARAHASPISSLGSLVPQGTIIPAVLETAIDSDLPGYTRGVVSRDVLSFDGRTVLIPRGSRLIGQYKSATALGATRAFVIWTRVIRTDGVSIQIGSPGGDPLGRAGLTGEVNRHFFTRFGGSILLSVLNAGVASVSHTPTTTVSIGSPGAAVGAAGAIQPDTIAPTIKVAQGSAINIFVARDLDFSDVGPVK